MKLYRLLTGPDDASFCHRGWVLHGQPTLTYDSDAKRVICGQAIIKDVDGDYAPELDLAGQ